MPRALRLNDNRSYPNSKEDVSEFLEQLTELSRKFGVGITGMPVLFLLEKDDYDRRYRSDTESSLDYA
jgi:hypothetical protein